MTNSYHGTIPSYTIIGNILSNYLGGIQITWTSLYKNPVQFLGENNVWLYVYNGTCPSNSNITCMQILTINANSIITNAIGITQINILYQHTQLVSESTKTYYFYTLSNSIPLLINKYDIVFIASNFVTSLNNSNNTIYYFNYLYKYQQYVINVLQQTTLDNSSIKIIFTSPNPVTSYIPFQDYIMSEFGNLFNLDLFYNHNILNNIPILQTVIADTKYYLAYVFDSAHNLILMNIPLVYTPDSAGNISNEPFFPPINQGPYITIINSNVNYNYINSKGIITNTNASIYNYNFANITINPDNSIKFNGHLILQIETIVTGTDHLADTCCEEINSIISCIEHGTFNIGTLSNYKNLINDLLEYSKNFNKYKQALNLDQIIHLEEYANNISNLSSIFTQLINQLNLDDSELKNVTSKIKNALCTIYNSIKTMKKFKKLVSKKNICRVFCSYNKLSSSLNKLTRLLPITCKDVKVCDLNKNKLPYTVNIYNGTDASSMFLINEGISYFSFGLPSNCVIYNKKIYYQTYNEINVYVTKKFYSKNFDLDSNDQYNIQKSIDFINEKYNNTHDDNCCIKNKNKCCFNNNKCCYIYKKNNKNKKNNNFFYSMYKYLHENLDFYDDEIDNKKHKCKLNIKSNNCCYKNNDDCCYKNKNYCCYKNKCCSELNNSKIIDSYYDNIKHSENHLLTILNENNI